jgi:hypothetical protein
MNFLCVKVFYNTALYMIYSIVLCKNCVYLWINDLIHIFLSLWHTYIPWNVLRTCVCMHVCMYFCAYICVYKCVFMYYVCIYVLCAYKCVCMYTDIHVYMCIRAGMCVCMFVCMCVRTCVYICMHVCVYVSIYVCVCMYVSMYVCVCISTKSDIDWPITQQCLRRGYAGE